MPEITLSLDEMQAIHIAIATTKPLLEMYGGRSKDGEFASEMLAAAITAEEKIEIFLNDDEVD